MQTQRLCSDSRKKARVASQEAEDCVPLRGMRNAEGRLKFPGFKIIVFSFGF